MMSTHPATAVHGFGREGDAGSTHPAAKSLRLIHVNATKARDPASGGMSDDPLIARADAAIGEARSLRADRRAIRDDADASSATLHDTLIGSMVTTDRSITARLLRREGQDWQTE
ncbi:MAG TPA: hypothetical protein VH743_24225 [Beijerinckiaceae bacterium]